MKVPIAYIDIRFSIHATEDPERVMTAIHNILPGELFEDVDFKRSNIKGHYNNPITLLKIRIKEKEHLEAIFQRLANGLTSQDKILLEEEIDQRLDKRDLFIRLDKQSAYLDEIRLGSTDPICLKIRFRARVKEDLIEICRRFGMLP